MNIRKYLEEMSDIQTSILDFLDYEDNSEENFEKLKSDIIKILDNQYEIKSLLYLLKKIANNHHRQFNFFNKIEQIFQIIKDQISKYFSNSEIFHIFKKSKRILLFLFEEKIITIDENISGKINQEYFMPEISSFLKENELPENFYEERKKGENDNYICKLIQKDLIEDFIIYVNKNSYPLNSTIKYSIYETNPYLLKSNFISLIEYTTFYGSIQIFNYLRLNGVKLNKSLWKSAIHGRNPEIIHILEENNIKPDSYIECFNESIKCHHFDIANYIQENYITDKIKESFDLCYMPTNLKYYNFSFIQNDLINESLFCFLCKYDYYIIVDIIYKEKRIDVNKIISCRSNILVQSFNNI